MMRALLLRLLVVLLALALVKGTGLEHPDALLRNWRGEFKAQYRRGRYFHMTLLPQHIGWSNRLRSDQRGLRPLRWRH